MSGSGYLSLVKVQKKTNKSIKMDKAYTFKAQIQSAGGGGAYIAFPYEVEKEFGVKGRVKVLCHFGGIPYRGSLVKMKTEHHIIPVLKAFREELKVSIGDWIDVKLCKDEAIRVVQLHPLLEAKFSENPSLEKAYEQLSYTNKKEMNLSLFEAKRIETQEKRLVSILQLLTKKIKEG